MKLGRLILNYREDLVLPLKDFYLGGNRTEFFVIAYNKELVDPQKFDQTDNFRLEPYFGAGGGGNISGQQFLVWRDIAKKYPQIEGWVIHDYDLLAKPSDSEIFSHLKPKFYGSIGKRFFNWQQGMKGQTANDSFPFPYHYVSEAEKKDVNFLNVEKVLIKYFPATFQNIPTILTGNSDFLAVFSKDLLLLDDPILGELKVSGIDQVTHTVFAYNKIEQVDLRDFFSAMISLDNDYPVPFKNEYDISHPVKVWPSEEGLKLKRISTLTS